MGKRPAERSETELDQLKSGERPVAAHHENEVIEYDDDYEDEFESEDEILEAGIDGQPDEAHEAEESRGTWITLKALCEAAIPFTRFIRD